MSQSMGQGTSFPVKKTLVINPANPLIKNAFKLSQNGKNEKLAENIIRYVEDLATISSEGLTVESKEGFVSRSQNLLQELTNTLTQ